MNRSRLLASAFVLGFFFLLLWFYVTNVYQLHFYDTGGIVVAWQVARIIAIPYLLWLQYALGALVLRGSGERGLNRFILSFLLGTSLWHILLLAVGLAGLLFYPVMLLLAGGVMVASTSHLAACIQAFRLPRGLSLDEKMMTLLVILAAITFVIFKGAYPSGGHDFFNHYFSYYKEVIESGNLGPHNTWYQYHYSKGAGLYFLAMILFDPLAVHLVGTTFVAAAACMVFSFLRKPGQSLLLPLLGVFFYLMMYIYTSGRGLFAANGGWGDLEKIHELTAVLILGMLWLVGKEGRAYAWTLYAVCIAHVILGFASGLPVGLFFAVMMGLYLLQKDMPRARNMFNAGLATALSMLAVMVINYFATGLVQDQLASILWSTIDWKKVVSLGYTLELYAHVTTLTNLDHNTLPFWNVLPKMIIEYNRLYMLWPLFAMGALLVIASRKWPHKMEGAGALIIFLTCTMLFAIVGGGRTQFISFFRFSTCNYAPTLILCFMLWQMASPRMLQLGIRATLGLCAAFIVWGAAINPPDEGRVTYPIWLHFKVGQWEELAKAAYNLNTGEVSIYNAIQNQKGRVGRMKWGGVHPAMRTIYSGLPPKTRIWSFYNHSYCLLPECNVQQYFSQITSPRWYDIALGSIEDGKKIMQSEGLNFFFYSRNMNTVIGSDTKDQLPAFYKGLTPENIGNTFGILWSNGWDYLLTWKEESVRPLDENFLTSWKSYYETSTVPRKDIFPVEQLAVVVKKAVEDPGVTHPPAPPW